MSGTEYPEPHHDPEVEKKTRAGWSSQRIVGALGVAMGLVLLIAALLQMRPPAPPPSGEGVVPLPVSPSSSQPVYDEEYLKDKLYITQERAAYQSGQLVLKVPALGLDAPVQAGTTDADLDVGPSLYEYAQLPGEGTPNVSIVAHRDIGGAQLYFAHKLGKGDLLYLVYNNTIYQYAYEDTHIVLADDWSPIYNQGFSCLTLTTCNPIGSTRERLVVRAKLLQTLPYTKEYRYQPWAEGIQKPYAWESGAKSWNEESAPDPSSQSQAAPASVPAPEEPASVS